MEVIKVSPRGYCYGVVDALQVVQQAVKATRVPHPIYILGQISTTITPSWDTKQLIAWKMRDDGTLVRTDPTFLALPLSPR